MSATDELRQMLDERGVEYHQTTVENIASYLYVTTWDSSDGHFCEFHEIVDGEELTHRLVAIRGWELTPEQVIDMTLGRETCQPNELIRSMRQTISCEREAYEMLSRTYDAALDHIRYQKEQLDEMRSKLEDYKRGGTCTMLGSSRPSGEEDWDPTCVCSECHAEVMTTWLGNEPLYTPHYCPNCGRRVEQNI